MRDQVLANIHSPIQYCLQAEILLCQWKGRSPRGQRPLGHKASVLWFSSKLSQFGVFKFVVRLTAGNQKLTRRDNNNIHSRSHHNSPHAPCNMSRESWEVITESRLCLTLITHLKPNFSHFLFVQKCFKRCKAINITHLSCSHKLLINTFKLDQSVKPEISKEKMFMLGSDKKQV